MAKEIRVLELFAGIGACSKALTNLGIPHRIVDAVEIDKYAIKSFNAIHGTDFVPQDISQWDKDLEVDLIMHGSPCQDFSVAGKQAGGDEGSGTRSSLMYETLRIVEKLKPKYVIWENVKNLLSKKHRHNFDAYLKSMEDLGYHNDYKVLNAKDYGIPQNRDIGNAVTTRAGSRPTDNFVLEPVCVASRGRGENNEQHLEPRRDGVTNTITTVQKDNYIYVPNRLRKLTPKECWRLMGFDDSDIEKAENAGASKTQLYHQAGNSIVVNCIQAIMNNMIGETYGKE